MLHFFRTYQKYFFLLVVVAVISSVALFGVYPAAASLGGRRERDRVAFRTLDGREVMRSYLDHMCRFLEREAWMQPTEVLESNYLNEGVISKDFLEGGLAPLLLAHFGDRYREELAKRLSREQHYTPYRHPYASFLSAESLWSLVAPKIPELLATLTACAEDDPLASFETRVALFLAEHSFPPALLTHILRRQEREYAALSPDPRLQGGDIRLFGYRDVQDWFGPQFIQSVAEVILNTSAWARQRGYSVSYEEARADLLYASQKVYKALASHGDVPVEDGSALFQIYLKHKGLDESTAVRLWSDFALFRRVMQDVGSAALVDALPFEQFYACAQQSATLDLYRMAPEFRFSTEEEAQLFAAYARAIALEHTPPSVLPLEYAPVEVIAARAPEIVGVRYRVQVGSVHKQALQARVSLKETWEWECAHWEEVVRAFPQLAGREGRPFEILEGATRRHAIDAYARAQIVDEHPEWIDEALKEASLRTIDLFLPRATSGRALLVGITDPAALQAALEAEEELWGFTQDQATYYHILVERRPERTEVLSFKEAKSVLKPLEGASPPSFASYLESYDALSAEERIWDIECQEQRVSRGHPSFISLEEALALEVGACSPVHVDPKEGAYCFRVKAVQTGAASSQESWPLDTWGEAQELLAKQLRVQFFTRLLAPT